LPLRIIDLWRADLPFSTLLLDGDISIDSPHIALAFLVALDKSIVLAKVMSHTRLPPTCRGFELVPRVVLLDVVIDLLEVHLTRRGRRNRLVNENNVIGRRTLQLLFCVVFNPHLWGRSTRRFSRFGLLLLARGTQTIAFLGRLSYIVLLSGNRLLAACNLRLDNRLWKVGWINARRPGLLDLLPLLNELGSLSFRHEPVFRRSTRPLTRW
jgi:hypothetical protein